MNWVTWFLSFVPLKGWCASATSFIAVAFFYLMVQSFPDGIGMLYALAGIIAVFGTMAILIEVKEERLQKYVSDWWNRRPGQQAKPDLKLNKR
jgi:hypothetical protein